MTGRPVNTDSPAGEDDGAAAQVSVPESSHGPATATAITTSTQNAPPPAFTPPGGALMAIPTWADALREGQSVQVALGAVAVVCIGVGAVHVGAVQVNDHGQVEEDAVSTLLAVLQLRDIARRETGRLPVPADAHTVSWHTVHLGCPIACLKLSKRPYNALHYKFRSNSEQATVANLLALNEQDLHDIRNLGSVGIEEITTKLATAGFRLGAHPGPRPE